MPSFIDFVYGALLLAAGVNFIFNILVIPGVLAGLGIKYLDDILNPSTIYRRGKVNKFGTILATIFHNIFFFPHAIWFWVYKACTAGI